MKTYKLSLYSILHFLVDLVCCYTVISIVLLSDNLFLNTILITVCYNFSAFALQAPIGLIVDYFDKAKLFQLFSFILLMLGLFISEEPNLIIFSCVLMGIGNSLFHLSFGVDILNEKTTKSSYLGIFISTGALGVSLGTFLAISNLDLYIVFMLLLLLSILVLSYMYKYGEPLNYTKCNIDFGILNENKVVILILMFIVVLRSYMGGKIELNLGLDNVFSPITIVIINTLPLVLGKAFGGILADKYGLKNTIFYSLCISTVFSCIYYFTANMFCAIITIFTFNMTMPITLYLMKEIISCSKGFAFGLLTFSLYIGYIISLFVSFNYEYIIVSVITFVCLYYVINRIGVHHG